MDRRCALRGLGASAATALLASQEARAITPAASGDRGRLELWGYYPWWLRDHWRKRDLSPYTGIYFFDVGIGDDGALAERRGWPDDWQALQSSTRTRGRTLQLALTLFGVQRFERVFADAGRRRRFCAQALELARGCDGLHLDIEVFEAVSAPALAGLRECCAVLRRGLRELPSRPALSAFGVMGARSDLYDPATLDSFDRVVVQGYDSHHPQSEQAGPVAPLRGPYAITWESALAHYLKLGARRERLVFGLPFFGYEWPTASDVVGSAVRGRGTEMTYALSDPLRLPRIPINASQRVATFGLRRDPASGSPYYVFRDADGGWHQGWFEDETSLAAKLAFARRERLAGVAVFPIGYDDGAFDALLKRAVSAS